MIDDRKEKDKPTPQEERELDELLIKHKIDPHDENLDQWTIIGRLPIKGDPINKEWVGSKAEEFAAYCAKRCLDIGLYPKEYKTHLERIAEKRNPEPTDAKAASHVLTTIAYFYKNRRCEIDRMKTAWREITGTTK